SAWNYWIEQLRESDTDWPAITRQLKILLASDPRLDSAANRSLLNSLDATLVPGKAKPGSIEAMIDDLVQVRKTPAPFQCTVTDPKQLRVLQLGFDAVPHLIEHLDDQRLTLSGDTVGRLAAEMVQGLAGSQFSKDLDDPEHDWTAWKADARAWWEKAKNTKEESYLLTGVLPSHSGRQSLQWPNGYMLAVIQKKYPRHLTKLYRDALDKYPRMVTSPLAEAVTQSSLPKDTKLELLLSAASNKDAERRYTALCEIRSLAPRRFRESLIANLERMPKSRRSPIGIVPNRTSPRSFSGKIIHSFGNCSRRSPAA